LGKNISKEKPHNFKGRFDKISTVKHGQRRGYRPGAGRPKGSLNKTSMASLKQYEKLGDRRRRLTEPSTEPAQWVSLGKTPYFAKSSHFKVLAELKYGGGG
jgi:hypothetical protein